jgi:hypothetical protein
MPGTPPGSLPVAPVCVPSSFYHHFPLLVEDGDRLWRWPEPTTELPLLFSLRASKAGPG